MGDGHRVEPDRIRAFRERHKLDQSDLDRLFGFESKGRSTRRWEAGGGPAYVAVLIEYGDRYGIGLMKKLAAQREEDTNPVKD